MACGLICVHVCVCFLCQQALKTNVAPGILILGLSVLALVCLLLLILLLFFGVFVYSQRRITAQLIAEQKVMRCLYLTCMCFTLNPLFCVWFVCVCVCAFPQARTMSFERIVLFACEKLEDPLGEILASAQEMDEAPPALQAVMQINLEILRLSAAKMTSKLYAIRELVR